MELEPQPPEAVEDAREQMPTVQQESRQDHQLHSPEERPEFPPEEEGQFGLQDVQDNINHAFKGKAAAVSGKEGLNSEPELDSVSEVQDDSDMADEREDGLTPHNEDHHQQQREKEQQEEQGGVESNGMGSKGLEPTTGSDDKVTSSSGDDDQLDSAQDMEGVRDQQEISEMRTGVDRSVVESDTATEEHDKSEVTGVVGEYEQDLEQTADQELVIDGMPGEGSDSLGEEKEGNEEEGVEDDRKTDEEPKEGTHNTRTPPLIGRTQEIVLIKSLLIPK